MDARSHKAFKFLSFLRSFWKNDPLRLHFYNSVLKFFIISPTDVLCANFVKFGYWEMGEIVLWKSLFTIKNVSKTLLT